MRTTARHQWVTRQKGSQMTGNGDGTYPGAAAAMGDAKSLVEVEVANISSKATGLADPNLGIEIGTIEVDLTAVAVDHGTDITDALFKNPMGGGVSDHQRSQVLTVLLSFGSKISLIDIAVAVALNRHHLHPSHHGAGRIGAVGTCGNQTDIAVSFPALTVEGADHQQASVLALRTSIGLQ